jgi:hypothetical protein
MLYQCKACQNVEGRGVLPGTTCGLLIFGQMGIAGSAMMAPVSKMLAGHSAWWWVLATPSVLLLSLPAAYVLNLLLEAIEWLLFCRCRCENCGGRRWSWGFTQGFGL